jgi:hypothetical protein
MARGPWKFKPTVLAKALTEARSAGGRVKISQDGSIEIDFGKSEGSDAPAIDTPDSVRALI